MRSSGSDDSSVASGNQVKKRNIYDRTRRMKTSPEGRKRKKEQEMRGSDYTRADEESPTMLHYVDVDLEPPFGADSAGNHVPESDSSSAKLPSFKALPSNSPTFMSRGTER
jgi:hypothetical protein